MDRSQHCILVVDDNEATRYALARTLRAAGFKTMEAGSGAKALELTEYVSAAVLDVHLPDLLGLEVCRLLRARPATASLPVVLISAVYVTEHDRAAAKRAGADVYMTAPIDHNELTATLLSLIEARESADRPSKPGQPS